MSLKRENKAVPLRGEIWMIDLNPTRGHEQAGLRPALIVSVDEYNRSQASLTTIVPITGTDRKIPLHVPLSPPESGLDRPSFLLTDQIRTVSKDRLVRRRGRVEPETMKAVEQCLSVDSRGSEESGDVGASPSPLVFEGGHRPPLYPDRS